MANVISFNDFFEKFQKEDFPSNRQVETISFKLVFSDHAKEYDVVVRYDNIPFRNFLIFDGIPEDHDGSIWSSEIKGLGAEYDIEISYDIPLKIWSMALVPCVPSEDGTYWKRSDVWLDSGIEFYISDIKINLDGGEIIEVEEDYC